MPWPVYSVPRAVLGATGAGAALITHGDTDGCLTAWPTHFRAPPPAFRSRPPLGRLSSNLTGAAWQSAATNVLTGPRWEVSRPTVETNEFFRAVVLP